MVSDSDPLERLIDAHLSGEHVDVPASRRAEFEQALVAHQALRMLLDETPGVSENSSDDRVPPDVSAHYDIERELGRGGMGVVYLARQRSLNRQVALKVLRPGERTFGPLLKRFREEAQHLAQLRHPNIVSIHEVGEAAGEPYFTMDFIDGEPLSAVIARGPLSPSRAVAVFKQVAAAVQHAHRHGIIHRDLKPGNVLLDTSGHAYVTDFGLARNITQESNLTQSGELLGTPQYMAPEQARGETSLVGESTDIHALGLLLFEMLSGRPAYASSSPADVLVKLLNDAPLPLRSFDRRIPRDLETICQKMLQKSPSTRYANVSALLEDIRRYEAGEPLIARRTSIVTHAMRWARRHWTIAAAALLTAAVAVAVVPPLFDKSFEQLVSWGDEELASGNPDVAAKVYTRALKVAAEQQRQLAAGRIVQACRDMEDPKSAVQLALQVIDLVPKSSFGRYDYLVAQALVTRQRTKSLDGVINIWSDQPESDLNLVKARLELAWAGSLTDPQRTEVQRTLSAINMVLTHNKPSAIHHPQDLYTLPTGSAAELQAAVEDESRPVWDRARAAIAWGNFHEQQHRTADALAAYRRAYDLARSVYPVYGGVKASVGSKPTRPDSPDAQECLLVRELAGTLHRLAPESFTMPQGGLEFDVVGFRLPPSIGIDLSLELCDPEIDNPNFGLPYNLPRLVPLRQDGPVRMQVLDGTYRLQCRGNQRRSEINPERLSRLIQVDMDQWPDQIEVRGSFVRLPPVQLRVAEEIHLTTPVSGAAVDLSETELQWEPVAGASQYQVNLLYTAETPSPTTFYFLTVTTSTTRLRLADLTDIEQSQVRKHLISGRTGGWRVDAHDQTGKCIGTSLVQNRFLVAGELREP